MKTLSRVETAAIVTISVASGGVLASSVLAKSLGVASDPKPQETPFNPAEMEIKLPSMPKTKDEFYQTWAEGYMQCKPFLKKFFHLAGVTFLAPIFASGVDDLYNKWQEYENSQCPAVTAATQ